MYHHNGIEENMRALKISNETTVVELIPMLMDKFRPEMRNAKEPVDYSNHYIVMILDGGMYCLFLCLSVCPSVYRVCVRIRACVRA